MTIKISEANIDTATLSAIAAPKVANIQYAGEDDTAASTAGGELITINGSGFAAGASILIGGTVVGVVTFMSSSQLTFISPANTAGSYVIYVINTDGGTAIAIPGIQYSGTPTWTTAAGTLGSAVTSSAINITLAATGDAPVTYSVYSGTLPIGVTLNSTTGSLSGTAPSVSVNTTYNFVIRASDAQKQDTNRSFSLTISASNNPATIEYLVVGGAGGGGAAGFNAGAGGGGGAGGYLTSSSYAVNSGSYNITVGSGGAGGDASGGGNGSNSSIGSSIIALGGGGGQRTNSGSPGTGGSGGGGGHSNAGSTVGAAGTPGQGNKGGNDGGGGGGAGGVGSNGPSGAGGASITSSISGSAYPYAGGGNGGSYFNGLGGGSPGVAYGRGGNGADGINGSAAGGFGANGIVIIRYADTYDAAASTTGSPTITVAGGYRVYKFTSSGSITF